MKQKNTGGMHNGKDKKCNFKKRFERSYGGWKRQKYTGNERRCAGSEGMDFPLKI